VHVLRRLRQAGIADKKDINYDGSPVRSPFDKNGDPTEAYVSIYKYATGNADSLEQQVVYASCNCHKPS
jgi:hypothetical protein